VINVIQVNIVKNVFNVRGLNTLKDANAAKSVLSV